MKGQDLFQLFEKLDDDMIADAGRVEARAKGPRLRRRTLWILAALVAAILTACTAYTVANWDEIFVEHFKPTEDLVQEMENSIQTPPITSDCDGIILSVRQTLGDDYTLNIILDITFPDDISLSELLGTDEHGDAIGVVSMDHVRYRRGETTYEEIRGMNSSELDDFFFGRASPAHSSSLQTIGADFEENQFSYLLSFTTPAGGLNGDYLTLCFEDLKARVEGEETTIRDGPFVISWLMENSGTSYRTSLYDENDDYIGFVFLSAFAFEINLLHSEYDSLDAFCDSIRFIHRDGGESTLPGAGSRSSGFGLDDGSVSVKLRFRELLDLKDIQAVHIGEYYMVDFDDLSEAAP